MKTAENKVDFLKGLSVVVLVAGAAGSCLCVPYAIGTDWYLVSIAGVYFIAGAIMIVGGLFTYAYLSAQK
jgi:hypothetical protein